MRKRFTEGETLIEIRPLIELNLNDLERVASGYSSTSKFVVTYKNSADCTAFDLQLTDLDTPYIKVFDHDEKTLHSYREFLQSGYSFGAYDTDLLVGLIIAEPHEWNASLWVWEFHVIEAYRQKGIGKKLMDRVVKKGKRGRFRVVVCETQNTNAPAIQIYRKLGFAIEGIDLSYYSNDDYPDGEIAVFMKLRMP